MLKPTDKVSLWADERVTGLQRGVNAEQASLQPMIPEAEPFYLSAKTAWAISDWLKG